MSYSKNNISVAAGGEFLLKRTNILGLSEIRWVDSAKLYTNHKLRYYSGNNVSDHRNGVGGLINQSNFVPLSDGYLLNTTYTADKTEKELEKWYQDYTDENNGKT